MTPRKAAFVEAYLSNGGNATKAAVAAGYSERSAYNQGARMMKDDEVRDALHHSKAKAAKKLDVTAERVIAELAHIAFSDPRAFIDKDTGALKPIHELPKSARAALASIEIEEETEKRGRIYKLKRWDKPDALEKLGRHLGIFQKDNEQVGDRVAMLVMEMQRRRSARAKASPP